MFHLTKKRAVAMAVAGSLALSAGAYAFFTTGGSGTGTASVGDVGWQLVTQATTDGPMIPGGPAAKINYTVKNTGSGVQSLAHVAISVADAGGAEWTVAGTPPCTRSDFNIGSAGAGVTYDDTTLNYVQPGETVTRTATIEMVNASSNQDACKNATPPLYLSAT
jgi:hypothetical protein